MKKRVIVLMMLTTCTISMNAQSNTKTEDLRQKLNLDYSMPDYHTSKIDPQVVGPRLALLLQELCAKYKDSDKDFTSQRFSVSR